MSHIELIEEVYKILRNDPSKMYSREEILNLLVLKRRDDEIEELLAELEVTSSLTGGKSDVYSVCRGGTVYYKWNNNNYSF
ncbi:MAG: hypothetical protein M3261_05920 [Thermoproteota archaeon]|nr:hypothetical protein [Thermoproteota archaeon]